GVDIVEPYEPEVLGFPRRRLRPRPAGARRRSDDAGDRSRFRDAKTLDVEIRLDEGLAREIDRGPSVQLARTDRAGNTVDHQRGGTQSNISDGGDGVLQHSRRFERGFDRHTAAV